MNKKKWPYIFLILFALSPKLYTQNNKWQGTKTIKNDIIYIHNPEKPIYFNEKLPFPKLTEVLSIGVFEGDERYVLGGIWGIAFNSKKDIYLLDGPNHCIKVYEKNGKYLQKIGKGGEGPGEFNKPTSLNITSDDRIVVLDSGNRRISILNSNGEFKHSTILPSFSMQFLLNRNNEIILVRILNAFAFKINQGKYSPFMHLNMEGKELFSYGESHVLQRGGYSSYSYNFARIMPNNNLLTVFDKAYKIHEYDSSGKLVREINKKDRMLSEVAILHPKGVGRRKSVYTRATIQNLYVFPDGSFLIKSADFDKDWKRKKTLPFMTEIEGVIIRLDYFNKAGQFVASYSWDSEQYGPLYFIDMEGYAYTKRDADGVPKLTKYEISFNHH